MYIVIRQHSNNEYDEHIMTYFGTFDTVEVAQAFMEDNVNELKSLWDRWGGECEAKVEQMQATLFNGDMWDFTSACKWCIFDLDDIGQTYRY